MIEYFPQFAPISRAFVTYTHRTFTTTQVHVREDRKSRQREPKFKEIDQVQPLAYSRKRWNEVVLVTDGAFGCHAQESNAVTFHETMRYMIR